MTRSSRWRSVFIDPESFIALMTKPHFTVRIAHWSREAETLQALRSAVFIREQGVPESLEWDGLDASCTHVIAEHAEEAIGTARLLADGQIGRMAVLPTWRRHGVGSAMLALLIQQAITLEMAKLWLNAQSHAVPFYAKFGFNLEGKEFMEAGIPHRRMLRRLG